jgi:hypothetical protein
VIKHFIKEFFTLPRRQDRTCFVLSVGDEGAILSYVEQGQLKARLLAKTGSFEELEGFDRLLLSNPTASIWLLVDVMDQTYQPQTLPGVRQMAVMQMVNHRLSRDYKESDLKGAYLLSRSLEGRRDWQYMFVSAAIVGQLAGWYEWALSKVNPLVGIALLPLETMRLVEKLNEHYFDKVRQEEFDWYRRYWQMLKAKIRRMDTLAIDPLHCPATWQIWMTYDRVAGGMRQGAYKNARLMFTRLITMHDESAEILAGNIELELQNSVEYLRRNLLKESETFDVFICVSAAIKRALSPSAMAGARRVWIYTPSEFAQSLAVPSAALDEDRYADVVLATAIANYRRPLITLHTAWSHRIQRAEQLCRWLRSGAILLVPIIGSILGYAWYQSYELNHVILAANREKVKIQQDWSQYQKDNYSIEEATKLSEVIQLFRALSGGEISPMALMDAFLRVRTKDVVIKAIDWQSQQVAKNTPKTTQEQVVFDMEFKNSSDSYEGLFDNFSRFVEQVKQVLPAYTVEYSRLPERIVFGKQNSTLPVQLTIRSRSAAAGQ